MPIYEYKCKGCGKQFSVLQPVTAAKVGAQCPHCSGTDTERVISTFGCGSGNGSCSTGGQFT